MSKKEGRRPEKDENVAGTSPKRPWQIVGKSPNSRQNVGGELPGMAEKMGPLGGRMMAGRWTHGGDKIAISRQKATRTSPTRPQCFPRAVIEHVHTCYVMGYIDPNVLLSIFRISLIAETAPNTYTQNVRLKRHSCNHMQFHSF